MFFLVFGLLNWLLSLQTSNVDAKQDLCTDWKLYGGRAKYEGLIMVNYNGTYVSLCNDQKLNTNKQNICKQINNSWSGVKNNLYDGNVFDVSFDAMSKGVSRRCKDKGLKVCGADDMADDTGGCCQPVAVCCLDTSSREICSASWSDIYNKRCHYSKGGQHSDYFRTRTLEVSKDFSTQKAWTKSALAIKNPACLQTTGSDRKDVLKQCAYKCLNNDIRSISDSKCTCTYNEGNCSCTYKNNGTECKIGLSVLRTKPTASSQLELCIAGSVKNGTVIFTAEDCKLFFQPLCFSDGHSGKTDDFSPYDSPPNESNPDFTVPIIIISCVVAILVFIVIILICKCRTCGGKGETFRGNSMLNRTYGRQLQRQQSINDEEYAIISEIELDSGTSFYKPRLPERSNLDPTYNKIEQGGAIITLDEYSSPSDMIKDKDTKYDPASEYTTTYDDPIRHNEQNIAECKRKSEVKDACEIQTLKTDVNSDKKSLESNDDNNKVGESYESIAAVCKDVDKVEKVTVDIDKPENKNDASFMESKEDIAEECSSSRTEVSGNVEVSVGNAVSYEDTNIIDGNFPTKSKDIFEEHVCLNCLKPEHLERLGIKIITNDKALESIESEHLLVESGDDMSTDNSIDSDGNVNNENGRECVICKNVYDCLGNLKKPTVTESDGEEYDHLRNYKETVL